MVACIRRKWNEKCHPNDLSQVWAVNACKFSNRLQIAQNLQ